MKHPAPGKIPLVADVEALLRTNRLGRPIEGHLAAPSTNTLAAQRAAEGVDEGYTVLAEHQTAGRGRLGRTWNAQAGRNLTFSLVLRPPLSPGRLGLVTLAGALAVAETLDAFIAPLAVAVKWPNDLLLHNRKCCGMLLESAFPQTPGTPPAVVLGIGLNVNQDAFAPALESRATSLLLEMGRPVPRAPLLAHLLLRLEAAYASLFEDEGATVRAAYEARMFGLHQPVLLRQTNEETHIQGVIEGISSEGALRLKTDKGLETFHAGEVTTEPLLQYD